MSNNQLHNLATSFYVDDLEGATIPASRLAAILEKAARNISITRLASKYLEKQGLLALCKYVNGNVTVEQFRKDAKEEQFLRKKEALAVLLVKEAEIKKQEEIRQAKLRLEAEKRKAALLALEQDPKYIAKVKNQNLRYKYELDFFIERDCFSTLMNILKRVDSGKRLTEKDLIWLSTTGEEYFSDQLKSAYHHLEAEYYLTQFKDSEDPWMAVNASSHYRKCSQPKAADKILCSICIEKYKSSKVKSALLTTHGGVKRDLKKKDEAIELGKKAHMLTGQNFRPCTLIGAVYMETGDHSLGYEWYQKAIKLGASERGIDSELRSIYMRADKTNKLSMRAHLLQIDPHRYRWVNK